MLFTAERSGLCSTLRMIASRSVSAPSDKVNSRQAFNASKVLGRAGRAKGYDGLVQVPVEIRQMRPADREECF